MTRSAGQAKRTTPRIVAVSVCVVSTLLIAIAGCASTRVGAEEVAATLDRFEQQRMQQAAAYARAPMQDEPAPATDDANSAQDPTSLREFIASALKRNPAIKQAEEKARAQAARIPQVTALPDPMVRTKTLPEPVRTAEGDNFFILGVSQKLPVPEKLDRAGKIALHETRIALQQLQETRLGIIADVKRAYFQLYAIDKTALITRENRDLMMGLIGVARGQLEAGMRAQEDVLRAQVELSSLEAQLVELGQRRTTAAAMLNRLISRPSQTVIPSPAEFDVRAVDAKLDDLFDVAVKANPELERIRQQIERDSEAVELARLAYWPDFTVGIEWMLMESREAFRPPPNPATGVRPVVPKLSEDASDNWAITVGFNIPIWWKKIEAGIRQARRQLAASEQQYAAARDGVYFRITDALERVRSQQELANIFRHTIIPQAQQAYEVSRSGYIAGGTDFLYVIDNWQKWLKFRIQYHRVIGELEKSVADLEQVLGMSIRDMEASS